MHIYGHEQIIKMTHEHVERYGALPIMYHDMS
jgi:hypothetical protein